MKAIMLRAISSNHDHIKLINRLKETEECINI